MRRLQQRYYSTKHTRYKDTLDATCQTAQAGHYWQLIKSMQLALGDCQAAKNSSE
jgi:hypothetical protein